LIQGSKCALELAVDVSMKEIAPLFDYAQDLPISFMQDVEGSSGLRTENHADEIAKAIVLLQRFCLDLAPRFIERRPLVIAADKRNSTTAPRCHAVDLRMLLKLS
jgi:hypothetical protein